MWSCKIKELFSVRVLVISLYSDGNWRRNEGMWSKVGNGKKSYWAPKTQKELDR